MSIDRSLDNLIRRLRKRVRLLLVERYALFGGSTGAIVSAILMLLSGRFIVLLDSTLWIGAVVAGVLGGCAYGLLRNLDDLSVALAADKRTGLKERLSTAVSLPDADELPDMDRAVISDAGEHFAPLRSAEVFRHRFGQPHLVFSLAMVLLLGVFFFPQIPMFHSKERRQEISVMKDEGVKITKIAKDIKKNAPRDKELKRLAARLEKLGRQMQSARMPKKQAMLSTRRLSKAIKDSQDRLAKENSASKPMDQAQAEAQRSTSELAKSVAEKIAKEKGIPLEQAMTQVPSDKRLGELAQKAGPLSQSEMRELEKLVSKYSNPSSTLPIPAELAAAMAKLMQNGDYQKAMQIMQKLAQKLNSGKGSPMDQKMLKAQMEALAKALKNTDLNKLAQQMLQNAQKLAQMSPEELQKMLDQMRKAQMLAKAGGG